MSAIDEFLKQYMTQSDFFQEASRLCAQQCETALKQNGIRSMVTYRAKGFETLRKKLDDRNVKKQYKTSDDCKADMPDLAGVRIALYSPGDLQEVHRLLESRFTIEKQKVFPRDSEPAAYEKRFSGYGARHYRLRMSVESLGAQDRFANALIEIQVASVLMHGWAEVEHDLVYKPTSGTLSDAEYAVLDQLNGLVLAGEIALEQLQNAAKQRLAGAGVTFNNHYELAALHL
jgi:ppGpp synthetase/RelA/SpoT-type nucleotidyltranferase